MMFVNTIQTPVTAKNKTDSGSGSGFSEMLDSGSKTNAESCWNLFQIRGYLCLAVFRIRNLQLKIRYHDPLNKHPGDDYFTI